MIETIKFIKSFYFLKSVQKNSYSFQLKISFIFNWEI